ncbi:MAG: hypothetical protein IPL01_04245 [Acidobacteria bacterium]|nr:hypothetical protein [Acidobacteriota bacterium]
MAIAVSFSSRQSASAVTFSKDVAPILYANCVSCHRKGEMAPMALMSYKDVRPWAKSIREKVVGQEMPPWFADPNHGQFKNDSRMTAQQIETIRTWVDTGAKEGDPKDLPAAPKFPTTGWKFGEPDVVLSMSEAAEIPADGTVPYKYYAVPTNFDEDKYIQAAEIKRGAPTVVHHVIISVREPGMGRCRPPERSNWALRDSIPSRPEIRSARHSRIRQPHSSVAAEPETTPTACSSAGPPA